MDEPPQNPVAYFSADPGKSARGPHPEPLTPEQLSQITHARSRYRKVRRAINVASGDAWTTAIFALLGLLGSIFSFSWQDVFFGLGMALVSYNSFRGLHAIRALNPAGAKLLSKNQLLLGAILLIYAGWNLYLLATNQMDLGITDSTREALNEAGMDFTGWIRMCYYGVYGGVAVFALVAQSLTAWYYSSRQKYIEAYLSHTAEWVVQMQKTGFRL